MTGVEGYVESAGSGLFAGINAARLSAWRRAIDSLMKQQLAVWLAILLKLMLKTSNR